MIDSEAGLVVGGPDSEISVSEKSPTELVRSKVDELLNYLASPDLTRLYNSR